MEGEENREQRAEISTGGKGDTEEDRGFGMAGVSAEEESAPTEY
jgi:hypothetical protein